MKAIILARVSSIAQDYTEQVNQLVATAINDGYKKEDLIIICNKESAIKNDEEHRLGLVEMKEAIKDDPTINCVYVREISRIGRRYDVLSSIKLFLVTNKIQLIVTDGHRKLLDEKGEISLEGSIMFEIACQSAIAEMRDKAQRFKEGKIKAVRNGKIVGSSILYGYTTDDNGYIKVDETTADVVRYIFDTYANTNATCHYIYRELAEKGVNQTHYTYETGGPSWVRNIIANPAYIGGISKSKANKKTLPKFQYKYPAIISNELWNKANDKLMNGRKLERVETKYQLYAKGIIKCSCGHTMSACIRSSAGYRCAYCHRIIGINQIEHVAWVNAVNLKCQDMTKQTAAEKARIAEEIETNTDKISVATTRIADLNTQSAKAYKMYVKGNVTEELYDETVNEIKDGITKQETLITLLQEKNVSLKKMIEGISDYNTVDPKAIETIEDEAERVKITHSVINTLSFGSKSILQN